MPEAYRAQLPQIDRDSTPACRRIPRAAVLAPARSLFPNLARDYGWRKAYSGRSICEFPGDPKRIGRVRIALVRVREVPAVSVKHGERRSPAPSVAKGKAAPVSGGLCFVDSLSGRPNGPGPIPAGIGSVTCEDAAWTALAGVDSEESDSLSEPCPSERSSVRNLSVD